MFSTFKIDPYAYDQYDFASLNHSDKRNLMSINYYMQLDIKSIVHPSIKSLPSFHVHRTFIICPLFLSQKLFRFFCINQTNRRPTSSSFSKTFVYIMLNLDSLFAIPLLYCAKSTEIVRASDIST